MKGRVILIGTMVGVVCGLALMTSCGTPVTWGVTSDYGSAQYSAKGGLVIEADASAIERRLAAPGAVRPRK